MSPEANGAESNSGVELWRIGVDTPTYEADDLSGKGAEQSGGRWNRPRTPLVYCSTSRALAGLETLVHLARQPLPLNRYLVRISVPVTAWDAAAEFDGAVGWDAHPAGRVSLTWGEAWAAEGRTLLAKVPSVVVPEEFNVLINPRHADIASLTAEKLRKWTYDPRLGSISTA